MRREEIERLLPTMYQLSALPDSPLSALIGVMDDLHRPVEETLDELDAVFDPYRSDGAFVPWLCRWLGLDWLVETEGSPGSQHSRPAAASLEAGRLRDVLAIGHVLAQWRGTEAALVLLLATATGLDGFSVEEPADAPFHLVVTAPADARRHEPAIRRSIEVMKPAAATATLVFEGADGGTDHEETQ